MLHETIGKKRTPFARRSRCRKVVSVVGNSVLSSGLYAGVIQIHVVSRRTWIWPWTGFRDRAH